MRAMAIGSARAPEVGGGKIFAKDFETSTNGATLGDTALLYPAAAYAANGGTLPGWTYFGSTSQTVLLSPLGQAMAQSFCTAKYVPSHGWVQAIQYACSETTCNTVCSNNGGTCQGGIHVYPDIKQTAVGTAGFKIWSYDGDSKCDHVDCGPNVCCCASS